MRYLAVDLGDKRTGIAVGDDELNWALPVQVLEIPIGDLLIDAIIKVVHEHAADEIVIGLPLHMDGTPGARVKVTMDFGNQLAKVTHLAVHYQDERLTSAAAQEQLAGSGKTHKQKKKVRDALAATEILKDFLRSSQSSQ